MTQTDSDPNLPPRFVVAAAPSRGSAPLAWLVSLALAALVGALLFVGGYLAAGSGDDAGCAAPAEEFVSFCEAYERLKTEFVDELDDAALAEGAIRGMFQFGVEDPYSGYMSPETYQQALGDLSGKFSGIGAEMAIKNVADPENLEACETFSTACVFVVVAPLAGSPAEAAGLQAGDIVTAVDGESVEGSTMADQIGVIRGDAGTEVTLSIRRELPDADPETFDLTITRAEITLQEVASRMLDETAGYIKLNGFSDAASQQFRDALSELIDDGAMEIVFDLRDNPGGYIEAAQEIGSQFIDSGVIFTQESSGDKMRSWESTGDGVATDPAIEVVVLVNGGSASASEIVAAALQESGRATVVGEPTFGKNTVQVWSRLPNDGGVRITISRWFTPGHNSVAPDGVQPDIAAARTAATPPEVDVALESALEYLTERRAVGERESQTDADGTPAPSITPSALAPGGARVVGIVSISTFC